jgi:hypothetical protein
VGFCAKINIGFFCNESEGNKNFRRAVFFVFLRKNFELNLYFRIASGFAFAMTWRGSKSPRHSALDAGSPKKRTALCRGLRAERRPAMTGLFTGDAAGFAISIAIRKKNNTN